MMIVRKIVKIEEEKCDGCGQCIPNCAEGAIRIIDGKAKILNDAYCDGLGACLGHCPQDAISIIEREAAKFDEEAVHKYLANQKQDLNDQIISGCPSSQIRTTEISVDTSAQKSSLQQWPIKLKLVPIKASFYRNVDLLLMADCAAVAYPDLHTSLLIGKPILIGCSKFDDVQMYVNKLTEIIKRNDINSITVVHMEVPCCTGLNRVAEIALDTSGKMIPIKRMMVRVNGEIKRLTES